MQFYAYEPAMTPTLPTVVYLLKPHWNVANLCQDEVIADSSKPRTGSDLTTFACLHLRTFSDIYTLPAHFSQPR
jgi:hypothetical protein